MSAPSEPSVPHKRYRDGARAILPIAVAAFPFGISWGVLAGAANVDWTAAIVMSATTFAGSAQFAAVSILNGSGGVLAAVAAATLLNARYAPISISVASLFRGSRIRRLFESQLIVDESWAVSGTGGRFDRGLLIGAGLVLYGAWVGGTSLGVLAGDFLGDPERLGLDAAFPALFLSLVISQVKTRPALAAALAGGAVALLLLPFAPAGVPIIAASAACLIGLRRPRP